MTQQLHHLILLFKRIFILKRHYNLT